MNMSVKCLASGVARRVVSFSRVLAPALMIGAGGLGALVLQTPSASAQNPASALVVSGLVRPIYVTAAPNDPTRIFIIEKQGRIRIATINQTTGAYTLLATPFLDVDPITTGGTTANSEQGLLGLAFHPNYPTDPRFFINYTAVAGSGDTVVAAYTVSANPNIANAAGDVIMTFDQPQSNHNGGWIGFGPDGFLYVASGDGGNFNDIGPGHTEPGGNGQDITSQRLGKILRVDVAGDSFPADANRDYRIPASNPFAVSGGDAEIWAFGLRNPWRPSFDRSTGDFWNADVGQDNAEEINFQPASGPGIAGRNYGWRCYEGNAQFTFDSVCTTFAASGAFTFPVFTYSHTGGNCSITGGYVYRGCAIPSLRGAYLFADFCSSQITSFRLVNGIPTEITNRTAQLAPGGGLSIFTITSFGEDSLGELYICDQTGGEIFKIVPAAGAIVDCNANGVSDAVDICRGTAIDCNADGIPDSCVSPLPSISAQPASTSACPGDSVGFSVAASSFVAPAYQWQFRTTPAGSYASLANGAIANLGTVSGATTPSLAIASLDIGTNGFQFRAVITNTCGATNSNAATLTFGACTAPRCNPADIAYDDGTPLPPIGAPTGTNNGVTEGDYNLFFAQFFDANAAVDIANDDGSPLPPFGPLTTNNGVTEGDYNLFFSIFFDGCAF